MSSTAGERSPRNGSGPPPPVAGTGAVPVFIPPAEAAARPPVASPVEPPGPASPAREARPTSLTWIALLILLGAIGVLGMVAGDALSRQGESGAAPLFWAGFLLIVVPMTLRLASRGATRGERVALVVAMGLLLYLTKVLHDPFTFVFPDEIVHLRNAEDILRAGALFPQNSILPVTMFYPGLESVTAAIAQATGLSAFGAGIVVIGAGRLLLMLTLFLLFEKLSGSSRVAGLAAVVYVANPNFLFWSAQFSYQSLALPLALLAVYGLACHGDERDLARRVGWTIMCLFAITAVVMTHHVTTFALLVLFLVISVAATLGLGRPRQAAWILAIFTAQAVALWLLQVAPLTEEYLSYIFRQTVFGVADTVKGTSETRQLFTSQGGETAPLWERVVGLGSTALIALALPLGLFRIWRRRRRSALLFLFGVAAAAYIAILPLRLVPSAWETANRASDFLFLGIGVTIALGTLYLGRDRLTVPRAALIAGFVGVIAVGGALAGWPPSTRLSQPYEATIGDRTVLPQGVAMADWSLASLGPGHRFVADATNGRLLLTDGRQLPLREPRRHRPHRSRGDRASARPWCRSSGTRA